MPLSIQEEINLFQTGYKLIGAIDEAGRGPLAGPVVAACVTLDLETAGSSKLQSLRGKVKDSKKLSASKREELFASIAEEFCDIGVGICEHSVIDKINILQASFLAMKKAVTALKNKPDALIIDGRNAIPNFSIAQKPIIGGDNIVFSIAAASIIAKVTRDRIMQEIHAAYPQYNFAKHKGYGTKEHLELIEKHGPSPAHRRSFKPISQAEHKNS